MTYEPSKELIEQIAKEHWQALLPEQAWRTGGGFEKAFIAVAKETISCPTICKAIELYENQPQWQDKPDKEGWWWYWQCDEDFCGTDIYYIHESVTGILVCDNFPLIDDLRSYSWEGIKWLYIPEPEPYKGED